MCGFGVCTWRGDWPVHKNGGRDRHSECYACLRWDFRAEEKQGKAHAFWDWELVLECLALFAYSAGSTGKAGYPAGNGYDIITYATGGETQGQPVICAGILTDRQGETWTMRVLDGADVHGDILLRGVEGEHTIAEIVQVTGTYDIFEHVRNPGGFQSRSYYLARNISGYYYAPQVTTITVNQREILGLPRYLYYQGKRILYELRIRADCQIAKLLPEEQASLVSGILLGENQG